MPRRDHTPHSQFFAMLAAMSGQSPGRPSTWPTHVLWQLSGIAKGTEEDRRLSSIDGP
jgi:hypothetical protein